MSTKHKNKKTLKMKRFGVEGIYGQIAVYTIVILSLIITIFPLFITIFNSVKTDYDIMTNILAFPSHFVFGNYKVAFNVIKINMFNSIIIAFVAATVNTFLGAALAYVFVRKDFFLKHTIFNIYIFVLMIPSIVGMPILYRFIDKVNLMNNWFAIWLPVVAGGQVSSLFLFRAFLGQQPKEIYDAANVDGANDFYCFFFLSLPLAIPIIMLSMVGVFTGNYNDYLWPGLVMRADQISPLMPILKRIVAGYENKNLGVPYAIYLVSGIPLIFVTVIGMKYFQDGDFAAGMKL